MITKFTSFSLLFFVCLLVLAPIECFPEDLSICGLRFPIESSKRMSDGTVKISLLGNAKLVPPSQLNDYVVTESFRNGEFRKSISPKALIDFMSCSLEQGETGWAVFAVSGLMESNQVTTEEFVSTLSRLNSEGKVIQDALLTLGDEEIRPELLAESLLKVGFFDLPWVRTYGARWAFRGGNLLRDTLLNKFVSSLSNLSEEVKVSVPADVLEALYGSDDPTVTRVRSVLSKVRSIQSALRGEDLSSVLSLFSSADNDPEVTAMLQPVLLETIHKEARNLLEKGRISDALLVLSRLEIERRTPTTHELVRNALEKLPITEINAIDHAGISEMLRFLCDKDEVIRKAWVGKLSAGINFFIDRGETGNAARLVERLATIPGTGNEIVDELRFDVAKAFYAAGDEARGGETLMSMSRVPSFTEKISLYTARLSRVALIVILLLVLACAAIGFSPTRFSAFLIRMKERFYREQIHEEEEEEDSPPELPRFVSMSAQGKYDPRLEEYSSLLQLFGLKLGSTEKQIKVAYRHKMKEVHPDLKGEHGQDADAEFIAFRGKYERLLELHRSRKVRLGEDPE